MRTRKQNNISRLKNLTGLDINFYDSNIILNILKFKYYPNNSRFTLLDVIAYSNDIATNLEDILLEYVIDRIDIHLEDIRRQRDKDITIAVKNNILEQLKGLVEV